MQATQNAIFKLDQANENMSSQEWFASKDLFKQIYFEHKNLLSTHNMAFFYFEDGEYEIAIKLGKKCLEFSEISWRTYTLLGLCYIRNSKYSLASEYLKKGLEVNTCDYIRLQLSYCKYALEEYDDAYSHLEKLENYEPTKSEIGFEVEFYRCVLSSALKLKSTPKLIENLKRSNFPQSSDNQWETSFDSLELASLLAYNLKYDESFELIKNEEGIESFEFPWENLEQVIYLKSPNMFFQRYNKAVKNISESIDRDINEFSASKTVKKDDIAFWNNHLKKVIKTHEVITSMQFKPEVPNVQPFPKKCLFIGCEKHDIQSQTI
jgi:tetratricopeptide (TPR) repeat protein